MRRPSTEETGSPEEDARRDASVPVGDLGRLVDVERRLERMLDRRRAEAERRVEEARREAERMESALAGRLEEASARLEERVRRESETRVEEIRERAAARIRRYRSLGGAEIEELAADVAEAVLAPPGAGRTA